MTRVGVVILAAGKGTRMRSRLPKVTHRVGGRPMLELVLRAAHDALAAGAADETTSPSAQDRAGETEDEPPHAARFVIVVGHERDQVRAALTWQPPHTPLDYIVQEPQLGTGDAVRVARSAFHATNAATTSDTILVLYGDTPLVRAATLRALLDTHAQAHATLTFLTGHATDPSGYGRILRDTAGAVTGIVEERHATSEQRRIAEVNSGIYLFAADWLWSRLDQLIPHPNGEYYLTDLVDMAVAERRVVATASASLDETRGVNDRVQLAEAEAILRQRILRDLMLAGVTIEDPTTTYVDVGVSVGQDTILRPGSMLRGATTIGERCEIGPHAVIRDSHIGDGCVVQASWLDSATMDANARIGPMSRLRANARLKSGANLGNFAEVKNATIGERVQMHHFSYIGDANVGANTNIGAGAITMNYDGVQKHHTEIGERVFIGSDTLLRAPITIGDDAATGGGAVVIHDVPPGERAVGVPARLTPRVRPEAPAAPSASHVEAQPDHPPERAAHPGSPSSPGPVDAPTASDAATKSGRRERE